MYKFSLNNYVQFDKIKRYYNDNKEYNGDDIRKYAIVKTYETYKSKNIED